MKTASTGLQKKVTYVTLLTRGVETARIETEEGHISTWQTAIPQPSAQTEPTM